jgi:hypothetical protein
MSSKETSQKRKQPCTTRERERERERETATEETQVGSYYKQQLYDAIYNAIQLDDMYRLIIEYLITIRGNGIDGKHLRTGRFLIVLRHYNIVHHADNKIDFNTWNVDVAQSLCIPEMDETFCSACIIYNCHARRTIILFDGGTLQSSQRECFIDRKDAYRLVSNVPTIFELLNQITCLPDIVTRASIEELTDEQFGWEWIKMVGCHGKGSYPQYNLEEKVVITTESSAESLFMQPLWEYVESRGCTLDTSCTKCEEVMRRYPYK